MILLLAALVNADCYMQHPRGSNNKLFEQSNNVNNDNRLFDSQNNANSGYQVGDKCIPNCLVPNTNTYNSSSPGSGEGIMEYYEGSELYVEWNLQHGSQNPFLENNIVIQYMCNDGKYSDKIKDGRTTATIPTNPNDPNIDQYGQHENHLWYSECSTRERNKGLFTADRNLQGDSAIYTRQNNNGNRRGLECPEERDYYPYWHPTPWRDIWVCTSKPRQCDYFKKESQNRRDKGLCSKTAYNNPKECTANGGNWSESGKWDQSDPACTICPSTRFNHNGNADNGQSPHYIWKIPAGIHKDGAECVLRIRYNISTTDGTTDSWNLFAANNEAIKNNPSADFVGLGLNVTGPLRVNLNTAQAGRTFEDRSHMFRIRKRPEKLKCGLRTGLNCRIVNLNVRGRRGNIQQVYPAVEYDFVPPEVKIGRNDYLHIQWTGSDANNQGNAGNGRTGTDRNNLVVARGASSSFPISLNEFERKNSTPIHFSNNYQQVAYMAFLGQTGCNDQQTDTNADDYCKLLNRAPAYINVGLVQAENIGKYVLLSTRNNAFSNRDQKSILIIEEDLVLVYSSSILAIGGAGLIAAGVFFGMRLAKRKRSKEVDSTNSTSPAVVSSGAEVADEALQPVKERNAMVAKFVEWWAWNETRMVFWIFFACCQVGAFLFGYFINQNSTYLAPYFPFAKGFGKILDFNLCFILIPVLRNFISFLRTTPAGGKLPLDDNIDIHKITGFFIVFASVGHIACHFLDFVWDQNNSAIPIYRNLVLNFAGLTGIVVTALFFVMYMFAMMKRKIYSVFGYRFDGYKLFLKLHQLWIPAYAVLWLHGSQFWQFSVFPLMFMAIEKFIQSTRRKREVQLVEAKMVGIDVLCVKMKLLNSGKRFRYKAGQYLFLCCPAINEGEYHPFTITSAPEEPLFSCHIRCREGMDWTFNFRTILGFGNGNQAQNEKKARSSKVKSENGEPIVLRVDGPYGSASEEVFDYEAVLLVGAGIGVTPFISILKSISMRVKMGSEEEAKMSIYFYWICRDQAEFNSFKDFFQEIIGIKFPGKLELNMYCTGEMNLKDVRLADYNQYSGRPNWNRIFKEKAITHSGSEIGVFLCGPPAIAQQLELASKKHSTKRSKVAANSVRTVFKFHKENF